MSLPSGWIVCQDEEGYEYYFNESTGNSSWDKPTAPDSPQVKFNFYKFDRKRNHLHFHQTGLSVLVMMEKFTILILRLENLLGNCLFLRLLAHQKLSLHLRSLRTLDYQNLQKLLAQTIQKTTVNWKEEFLDCGALQRHSPKTIITHPTICQPLLLPPRPASHEEDGLSRANAIRLLHSKWEVPLSLSQSFPQLPT